MQAPRIDGERLWSSLVETAQFGATSGGGVSRLALGTADKQARDWLAHDCAELGGRLTIDEVGNMFARFDGADATLDPIAMGSHLDTQPMGGRFDGILGVLGALEVLRTLKASGRQTRHPLLLVNWTNEEGARFSPAMLGSGVHVGTFDVAYALNRRDDVGVAFAAALDQIGYRGPLAAGATRIGAMFELHIEQGPVLEARNIPIGVVEGVQAIRWFEAKIAGRAAHAGSTPMSLRQDALVVAARLVLAVKDLAMRFVPGLATVGILEAHPGSANVVPGAVRLTIDIRHPDDDELDRMEMVLRQLVPELASVGQVELAETWRSPAVSFDPDCIAAVERAAGRAGLASHRMISGPGHDAAYVARIAPTAMIFVPCQGGVSHNEAEFATQRDCAQGAQVLLEAVLDYDSRAPGLVT